MVWNDWNWKHTSLFRLYYLCISMQMMCGYMFHDYLYGLSWVVIIFMKHLLHAIYIYMSSLHILWVHHRKSIIPRNAIPGSRGLGWSHLASGICSYPVVNSITMATMENHHLKGGNCDQPVENSGFSVSRQSRIWDFHLPVLYQNIAAWSVQGL